MTKNKAAKTTKTTKTTNKAPSTLPSASTTWTERIDAAPFLARLPPMADVRRARDDELDLGERMPASLRGFLAEVGFGRFGDGFLRILPPKTLDPLLDEWLGGHSSARVPFATTALGDILYFRDLRANARASGIDEDVCDVSVVDVRYKRMSILAMDLVSLGEMLGEPLALLDVLAKDFFDAALERLEPPGVDEVYGFTPALALGGSPHAANLMRVNAAVHLSILLQC